MITAALLIGVALTILQAIKLTGVSTLVAAFAALPLAFVTIGLLGPVSIAVAVAGTIWTITTLTAVHGWRAVPIAVGLAAAPIMLPIAAFAAAVIGFALVCIYLYLFF